MKYKADWYPSAGERFTVGPNKITGDRSWINEVWTCKCANYLNVAFNHPTYGTICILKDEYDFAPMECPAKETMKETKWEPKGGLWTLYSTGDIVYPISEDKYRKYGTECATEKQAEILRDMTHRNNLIFQAIRQKGYEAKNGRGYELYVAKKDICLAYTSMPAIPENLIDTEEHAREIIEMVGLTEVNQS